MNQPVFVSYSDKNHLVVRELRKLLELHGNYTWMEFSPK